MLYWDFLNSSLNQLDIPACDIGVSPSIDNLNTAPRCLSAKYAL